MNLTRGPYPNERNELVRLQNRVKIMSAFLMPHNSSEVEKIVGLSHATLADHIKALTGEGLLDQQDGNLSLSQNGIKKLDEAKTQLRQLEEKWNAKNRYPELYRHTTTPVCGEVGKTQYSGFLGVWSSTGQAATAEIVKEFQAAMITWILNSVRLKGLGTVKVDLTFGFPNAGP